MFHRRGFFEAPRPERPFRKGDFKYTILQYLKDKSSYGYEIIRGLETRFHGWYIPSPGIVYPTLQMLQEMGYVTVAERDGKRVYTITKQGRQFLTERGEFEGKIPENISDIGETMREFGRLAQLLKVKLRTANAEKLTGIREAISRAYETISKD